MDPLFELNFKYDVAYQVPYKTYPSRSKCRQVQFYWISRDSAETFVFLPTALKFCQDLWIYSWIFRVSVRILKFKD